MLIKAKTLKGYKLDSKDGEVGKVKEFYFDDKHWTIRYLVVDAGNWLTGNQVLISPYALVSVNKVEENIGINLTKKQIEDSPSLIRYLIIDTTNWFGGKKVLISPKWIDQITWYDSKVFVNLSST